MTPKNRQPTAKSQKIGLKNFMLFQFIILLIIIAFIILSNKKNLYFY